MKGSDNVCQFCFRVEGKLSFQFLRVLCANNSRRILDGALPMPFLFCIQKELIIHDIFKIWHGIVRHVSPGILIK